MRKISLFILVILFAVIACTNKRENKLCQIKELEKISFFNENGKIDKLKADNLIKAYISFAKTFPSDTLSPAFMFNAAQVYVAIEDFNKAIETFNYIIDRYPSHSIVPQCLFVKAGIYENNLHNLVEAKKIYEEIIKKYPNHPLSRDAKVLINNLGKSPDELLQSILSSKNK